MSTSTSYRRPEADPQNDRWGVARITGRFGRRATVFGALAIVALLAVAGTWLVAFSSVFGVRTVVVRGTSVLSAAKVRAAAAIPAGRPLVRLDTAAVARRVQRLAEVSSAQVDTSLPSTVTIHVTERQPVGYLHGGSSDVLVDRTGRRYRTVPHATALRPRLPRLDVPSDPRTTAAVATVAAALPASLRRQVRSIQAFGPQAIVLVARHGRVVRWGSAARNADKARIAVVLLRRPDTLVDVTDPDQPFTR